MDEVNKNLTYEDPKINTPFRKVKIIYADDTASGRPCPIIDEKITKELMPYYSNTHSNAYAGSLMHEKMEESRNIIKKYYDTTDDHVVIFTGNGATGTINHLVNLINYKIHDEINIYITIFEHNSNYLPWFELTKSYDNIKLHIIELTSDDDIDFIWLEKELLEKKNPTILNIISVTACSNVTGVIADISSFKKIVNKHDNTRLLFDCACLAPYKRIDVSEIDALFISGHKFLGGQGTPGILIAKKDLFQKRSPFCPGGGCVIKADQSGVEYEMDTEIKESAGTPNVSGIIRLGYIYKMYNDLEKHIEKNEHYVTNYVHDEFIKICKEFPTMHVIYLDKDVNSKLPIISFSDKRYHYNFIVVLLNDLFGIQTRGGISCCGLLGEHMKNKYNIGGWVRITFNWRMTIKEINFIISSVRTVLENGKTFLPCYNYNEEANHWEIKQNLDLSLIKS